MDLETLSNHYNVIDRKWSKTGIIPEHLPEGERQIIAFDLEKCAKYMVHLGCGGYTTDFIESIASECFETLVSESLDFFSKVKYENMEEYTGYCPSPTDIVDRIIKKYTK